jgi:hypothetical protein
MSKNYKPKPTAEEIIDAAVAEDIVEEITELLVAEEIVSTPLVQASTYTVVDGDTYAALGKKFAKSGETSFAAAQRIHSANGGKTLITGTAVNI